jgi:hypothetical protein
MNNSQKEHTVSVDSYYFCSDFFADWILLNFPQADEYRAPCRGPTTKRCIVSQHRRQDAALGRCRA